MSTMADPTFEKGVTIRTTAKAQRAIGRVVAAMKSSPRVRWKGGAATKEAVINAAWLWLDDQPEEFVEELMARYVARLEALMTDSADPAAGPLHGERAPVAPPPPRRRRSG